MSLKQPSKELEVTMIVSSRTLKLMSCMMNLELDINSRPSTLHNQMALLRGKIGHSLIWQGVDAKVNLQTQRANTRIDIQSVPVDLTY